MSEKILDSNIYLKLLRELITHNWIVHGKVIQILKAQM